MIVFKLNEAQIALTDHLLKFGHLRYEGPEYRTAEILSAYGLVEYTSLHHIRLAPGVTRVHHLTGAEWRNSEGEVLAVE